MSKSLKARLSDLRAASSINDLIAGNPKAINPAEWSIELPEGKKLIIGNSHPRPPVDDQGALVWSRVSRIRIVRIE